MRASKISFLSLDLFSLNIMLPALKADSDATIETGTFSKSRAIFDNIGYDLSFNFHHLKISKFSTSSSGIKL